MANELRTKGLIIKDVLPTEGISVGLVGSSDGELVLGARSYRILKIKQNGHIVLKHTGRLKVGRSVAKMQHSGIDKILAEQDAKLLVSDAESMAKAETVAKELTVKHGIDVDKGSEVEYEIVSGHNLAKSTEEGLAAVEPYTATEIMKRRAEFSAKIKAKYIEEGTVLVAHSPDGIKNYFHEWWMAELRTKELDVKQAFVKGRQQGRSTFIIDREKLTGGAEDE